VPFTRDDIRAAVERAGDAHWKALRDHHEDAYPNPKPTPGDVCKAEAERLNAMGLGDAKDFELVETRVERAGSEVRLTQVLTYKPLNLRLLTEPFQGCVLRWPAPACSRRCTGAGRPSLTAGGRPSCSVFGT